MNFKSLGFIGLFVLLIVPFVGFHLINLAVGIDLRHDYCKEPLVPLPYWLMGNSAQGLTFFALAMSLMGLVYLTKNCFVSFLFSSLIVLNLLFQVAWSIIGIVSLVAHLKLCLEHSEIPWVVVLVTIILQWVNIFLTICGKFTKDCLMPTESGHKYPERDSNSVFDP